MKSKIEKIKNNIIGDGLTRGITAPTNQQLMEKINELVEAHNRYFAPEEVDHLNSQDQEKENNFVHTVGTPMLDGTTTCSQDTPEEWEKEFENPEGQTYDDPTRIPAEYHKLWESHGVDGYEVLETYPESAFELDPEKVVSFIKQLLEEKEREAKKELLEQLVIVVKNGTPEEFQRVLDNLNNKKK